MKNKAFSVSFKVFLIVVTLFFLWGLLASINALMIPYLKQLFFSKENLAFNFASTFFVTYLIIGIPAVYLLNWNGYKKSFILGLILIVFGVFLFVFAAIYISYFMFFTGIFLMGSGITILQVAANTYVILMGNEEFAVNRLSLALAINSLGYIVALLFFLINDYTINHSLINTAKSIRFPYIFMVVLLILFLITLLKSKLHVFPGEKAIKFSVLSKFPRLITGFIAIFFYIGVEVGISYYIIDIQQLANFSYEIFIVAMIIYWGSMGLVRVIGYYILPGVKSLKLLSSLSLAAVIAVSSSIFLPVTYSFWIFSAMGILHGIMFPVIFSESLKGIKKQVNSGIGFLVMGISGGALIPKLLHVIKTNYSMQLSLILIIIIYMLIFLYGRYFYPVKAVQTTN